MPLNSVTKGGSTYYELYISCPVCNSRGTHTPQSLWQHHECGGTLYVGDNAHYDCNKCSMNSHVSDWKYGCPSHMKDASYDFISATKGELAAVIAMAGQLTTTTGVSWLQTFLQNLGSD